MKLCLAFFLAFCLIACSESSPMQVEALPQTSSSVVVESGAAEYLFDTLGAKEVKIAFRNDLTANLVYVHFTEDTVSFVEFLSDLDVYHPTVSPDGKWVAFGTSPETVGTNSEIYIQKLSPDATERIRIPAPAAIPRWRVLPSGDTVLIYVSNSGANWDDSFWNGQWTRMVRFSNGYLGTPEKIFTGSYHGGVSEDMRFAVTGPGYLRVHTELSGSAKDTVWYDSAQVCNVSLSTDGQLRTLFLDLGSARAKLGKEFSGTSYYGHHRILVADSLGNLTASIPSPELQSFEHPEWVYGSDRLVTAVIGELMEKVALVDVRDSSIHGLLSGLEFWHPDIWLGN